MVRGGGSVVAAMTNYKVNEAAVKQARRLIDEGTAST